jgi:hypothetical protein
VATEPEGKALRIAQRPTTREPFHHAQRVDVVRLEHVSHLSPATGGNEMRQDVELAAVERFMLSPGERDDAERIVASSAASSPQVGRVAALLQRHDRPGFADLRALRR